MKKFCSLQKFQILYRSRTIKLPIKTPRPDKILEKKWEFENLIDFAVLSIIYLQSLKSFKFVNSPQGTSRKGGSNRVQIWSVFQIWIDQLMRAIWVCSILLQIFSKIHPTFYKKFTIFWCARKKYFCIAFFTRDFLQKVAFRRHVPPIKNFAFFNVFSSFFLQCSSGNHM